MLDTGKGSPQAIVRPPGAVIVGKAAGATVIVRLTAVKVRPQLSVAVHVSMTSPPQAPGSVENVDGFDVPIIWQSPIKPLL